MTFGTEIERFAKALSECGRPGVIMAKGPVYIKLTDREWGIVQRSLMDAENSDRHDSDCYDTDGFEKYARQHLARAETIKRIRSKIKQQRTERDG